MPSVYWEGQAHKLESGESVLNCLLRAGVSIPHSCRAGVCQSCLLRSPSGEIPASAQAGLKPALVEQSCFLACICHPDQDLQVEAPGAGIRSTVRLLEVSRLSPSVLRVYLQADVPHTHRAGQYLTLFRNDGLARSYSIASLPGEAKIELHVRIVPNGQMSSWLASGATPGTAMETQGPAGHCFYTPDSRDQPILLAGTGTGLAPLLGILRDAIKHGHRGPIQLFHGAMNQQGLYLQEELEALVLVHPNVEYRPAPFDTYGPIADVILRAHPHLKGWRGFVCGDPSIVNQLKKRLFLAGMSSRDIYSDAFVFSPPSS